jgi:predicted transglutaminase-like cysteine proteinase
MRVVQGYGIAGIGRLIALSFAVWLAVAAPGSAMADPMATAGQDRQSNIMRVYGPTDPPYAFWRFCDEFAGECAKRPVIEARYDATPARLRALDQVNRRINHEIEPVTDLELYGVSDFWTLPQNGKGDCEDYALLKRHILIEAGWPSSALLITVVRDEKFEGHAILTARTSKGDYILDNKSDEMKLWHQTPYRFVMRQSSLDPKAWVALDPAQSSPPLAIAGVSLAE